MPCKALDRRGQLEMHNLLSGQFGHGRKGTVGDIRQSVQRRDERTHGPPLQGGQCVHPVSTVFRPDT